MNSKKFNPPSLSLPQQSTHLPCRSRVSYNQTQDFWAGTVTRITVSGSPFEDLQDDELGEHSRLEEHQQAAVMMTFSVTAARSRLVMEVPPYVEEHTERLAVPPTSDQAVLDRGIISESFFPHATTTCVTLVELCAGIGSGLEAVLLNGCKVNRYFYVDIDPVARDIARFRVANLSARFTNQFPPTAWAEAFSLPHDLNAIRDFQLDNHFARRQEQILVMAGWPCHDYSPAGRGQPGARAAILDKVISIIARLQAVQHAYPVGYMLENVALQENFNHAHVRNEVAHEVFSKVGTPIKLDAADVGSYASRVRNYWTNLSSQLPMQKVYNELKLPHKGSLYDILQPGMHPMPVTQPSRGGHNVIGKVRSVLPTLMSYRKSRAFRPGKAGSIYSEAQQAFGEPMAVERELAMGYEPGTTSAPEVDEGERCSALGPMCQAHLGACHNKVPQGSSKPLCYLGMEHCVIHCISNPKLGVVLAKIANYIHSPSFGLIHSHKPRV
jgi:site-specific DNA-cytosine methylase